MGPGWVRWGGGLHTCTGALRAAVKVVAVAETLKIHPGSPLLDELETRCCTCAMTDFEAESGRAGQLWAQQRYVRARGCMVNGASGLGAELRLEFCP